MEIKVGSQVSNSSQKAEATIPLLRGVHDQEVKEHHNHNEQIVPIFRGFPAPSETRRNKVQSAMSKTFQSAAHLANLLPTGTVIAFQLLSPVFTNLGQCSYLSRLMTSALLVICGLSCFLSSFTDSIKDKNGSICYGFATIKGLWIIDGSTTVSPELAYKYRLRFIDFVHAFMSILVFLAIVLYDENVVKCFFPVPSPDTEEALTSLPVGLGVICSMLFIVFPTRRNGIGFPLSDY